PIGIWLTHAHIDHVLGVPRLKADTGAPVYLHPADRILYDHVPEQALGFGMRAERLPPPDRELAHGDELRVGGLAVRVRHAPGHSPGSVVFEGQGVAFSGDVLFQGSIGRTDLPGADFDTLLKSIERELLRPPSSRRTVWAVSRRASSALRRPASDRLPRWWRSAWRSRPSGPCS